jgi:chemotaxis response regulator CheB
MLIPKVLASATVVSGDGSTRPRSMRLVALGEVGDGLKRPAALLAKLPESHSHLPVIITAHQLPCKGPV